MTKKSKRIQVHDDEILSRINSETMKLWNKYKIDMSLRELSEKTIAGYQNDLESWWIYIYKNQGNQSIVDLTEDDITEFLYFCKTSSISLLASAVFCVLSSFLGFIFNSGVTTSL